MASIGPNSLQATTALTGYRLNFGVAQNYMVGAFLMLTGSATLGSPGVLTNLAGFPNTTPASGSVYGAPTISSNNFITNVASADYTQAPFKDTGGDYTIYCVVQNTYSGTAGFTAISTYGADGSNGINTTQKGDQIAATSATNLRFKFAYYNAGTLTPVAINLTVSNLQTAAHCFCIQRQVIGTSITWTIYNLTDSGTSNPQTLNVTGTVANNVTQYWTMASGVGGGGGGTVCSLPLALFWQSAAGAGAWHTVTQVAQVYAKIKNLISSLSPSAPYVI